MKKLLSLFVLIPAIVFGASGDIKIGYKSSNNVSWVDAIFATQNGVLLGLNSSGVPYVATSAKLNLNAAALPAGLSGTMFQLGQADGVNTRVTWDGFAASPVLDFRRANGTNASKTAILTGEFIGSISGAGYGTTGYSSARASINLYATQTWTDSAQGTGIQFRTAPINTTSSQISGYNLPEGFFGPESVLFYGSSAGTGNDDTVVLQAALTARAGKTLNFGSGKTFLVSSTLNVSSGTTLVGASAIKAANSSAITGAILLGTSVTNVKISGLEINGNADNSGAHYGIHFTGGTYNTVESCYVHDTSESGIRIQSEYGTRVIKNTLIDCGRTGLSDNHGIMVFSIGATPAQNIQVSENIVKNAFRKGITVYSASPGTVIGVLISKNQVVGSGLGGIYVATAPGGIDHTGISVTSNQLNANYVNIEFDNVSGGVVSNNLLKSDTHIGMYLDGSSNVSITGNTVMDSYIHGILATNATAACSNLNFTGNDIVRPNRSTAGTGVGLYLNNATQCSVISNTITDAAVGNLMTHAILEDGTSTLNRIEFNQCFNSVSATNLIVQIGQSTTLANGDNDNVTIAMLEGTTCTSGPTGAYALTGVAAGFEGRTITINNNVAQTFTVKHSSGSSSAGNKILIGGAADLAISQYGSVTLRYSKVAAAWFVVAYKA